MTYRVTVPVRVDDLTSKALKETERELSNLQLRLLLVQASTLLRLAPVMQGDDLMVSFRRRYRQWFDNVQELLEEIESKVELPEEEEEEE